MRYITINSLETHMEKRHLLTSPKIICKDCGKEFAKNYLLRVHSEFHLPKEVRKIHQCPHCDKKFTSTILVKYHVKRAHEGKIEKSFVCHLCARAYSFKTSLEKHIESHNSTSSFECSTCKNKFKSLSLLKVSLICWQF